MAPTERYLAHGRGDRLRPGLLSTRYHVLRQLADALRAIVASEFLPAGQLLIDYGCGERPYEELFLAKFRHYIGADLPENPRADLAIGPDGSLSLEDGVADCVLSSQVLEHVARPDAYLAEARRVLRRDGRLVLSTHGHWPYHPDPKDYRRWTLEGLRLELESAGFRPLAEYAVLGRAATALQLLQDALTDGLPRPLRPVPGVLFQLLIGAVERIRTEPLPHDASVYIVVALRDH
jgi:SAM-dependent methyltransferase